MDLLYVARSAAGSAMLDAASRVIFEHMHVCMHVCICILVSERDTIRDVQIRAGAVYMCMGMEVHVP